MTDRQSLKHRAWLEVRAVLFALVAALAWLVFFYALRASADVPPPTVAEPTFEALAKGLYEAVRTGAWWPAAAFGLSVAVLGLRKFGPRFLPDGKVKAFLGSDAGGVATTVALAVLGGVVHAFAAGVPFGWEWAETVLKVAFTSMGGYAAVKKAFFGEKPVHLSPTAREQLPNPASDGG